MTHDAKRKVKVAVSGLGIAGRNIHLKALREDTRFTVVGVADPDVTRQDEVAREWGCPAFADIASLLAGCDAEVIAIASPTHLHEADATAVLNAGRHCLLEKPMAMDYQGAKKLCQLAEEKGLLLAVNHVHLYRKDFFFLQEILRSGLLGEVFEIAFNWSSYRRRNDWQTLRANGGGHLANHGTHALSLLLPLLEGRVISLQGAVRHLKDAGDADDHAHLLMETAEGRIGSLVVSTCCAIPSPRYVIQGTTGALVADRDGMARLRYYDGTQLPPLTLEEGPRRDLPAEKLPWVEEVREISATTPFRNLYDNLHAVLANGEPLLASARSALEVMRVVDWAISGCDPEA